MTDNTQTSMLIMAALLGLAQGPARIGEIVRVVDNAALNELAVARCLNWLRVCGMVRKSGAGWLLTFNGRSTIKTYMHSRSWA